MPSSLAPPPTKKRKLSSSSAAKTETSIQISNLESTLKAAIQNPSKGKSLNSLVDLLSLTQNLAENGSGKEISQSIYALYRVFSLLLQSPFMSASEGDEGKIVKSWVTERLNEYVELLGGILQDNEEFELRVGLSSNRSYQSASYWSQVSALDILMSILKSRSTGTQFHVPHFKRIVQFLLSAGEDMRHIFVDRWLTINDDIRWFFLREIG